MTAHPFLAVGPANFAGQATAWADAARYHLGVPARSFAYGRRAFGGGSTGFGYATDVALPHPRVPYHPLRGWWLERALAGVTHLALDGFLPLTGRFGRDNPAADLAWLARRGIRTAFVAHGSDVRDPDLHLGLSPTSYFRDAPGAWVAAARARSERNRTLAQTSGLPILVSTPDLCNDMPGARWLPLTIDVDEYAPSQQQQPSGPPSVLHLPSRSVPPIKGTQIIEPVLDDLDSRGVIRWVRSDIVPHATFRLMLAQVDIVIDQILGGSYGVTTVEAMAAGAVVVGNVEAHTVTHMPEAPPVVQASPQDLMTVLACVAADRDLRRAHVDAGGAFVRRWHDGRAAAAALGNFLCPGSNQQSGIR